MDEEPDVARKHDIGDTALSKRIEDDIAITFCPSLTFYQTSAQAVA